MEKKPLHSWAKIYTQMWNMALTEHIVKNNNFNHSANPSNPSGPRAKTGDWRDRCCWRFNKCTKWNCRFEHRCSVKDCGSYSHSAAQCPGKKKGQGHQKPTQSK